MECENLTPSRGGEMPPLGVEPPSIPNASPSPFQQRLDGIWFTDPGSEQRSKICSHLEVIAKTRNVHGEEWGLLLRFSDADGKIHEWAMPMSMLAGDGASYRQILLDKGVLIYPGRHSKNRLTEYLLAANPVTRALCLSRVGWMQETFVLPDISFGKNKGERILYQKAERPDHAFRTSGTLMEWQEQIGKFCVGNSRLVFSVALAFAPVLLEITGEGNGGFHLVGASSTGKSTILMVAGSVWGGGGSGFLRRWRATANGLESIAEGHCDCLLILDELAQVDPKEAGEIAYMLANGNGKERSNRSGGSQKKKFWRLLFLSAGEIDLRDHLASIGKQSRAGQEIRLAEIPIDAGAEMGAWENIHGVESPDSFSRLLVAASQRYYGTPIRAFLQALIEQDRVELAEAINGLRTHFIATYLPKGASGEVSRVINRFALVAAAGELAIDAGILLWPEGESIRAAGICFRAWLDARGGVGASEEERAVAQARHFLQTHGSSRFADTKHLSTDARIHNQAGYWQTENGEMVYLVLSEVFRNEVCKGFPYRMVLKSLEKRKFLVLGSGPNRFVNKARLPDGRRPSVYKIRAAILEEE